MFGHLNDGAYFCLCAHVLRITEVMVSAPRARWVDMTQSTYATKYTTKLKAKFSYCDQIKFNEPVLKPGTPEQQHITNH